MAGDVKQLLEGLGLGQYAPVFEENAVDLETLPHLSEDDLKELGLPLGHRRKLQAAIRSHDRDTKPSDQPSPEASETALQSTEAERRHLTVLFCDLVGSTELSSKLDPEDMREVLRAYQEACSKVIDRYEGYVAKFMGDGVYAYFGYPTAHEDDAERAITAGLGIVEAVGEVGRDLAVRIGIATGNVAVGDLIGEGASEEANVVGEAPNLAGRLQAIAKPGSVAIGEATHRLVGGMFETVDLGDRNIKGFARPVHAWSVVRPRRADSRFDAIRGEHITPLVGRDEELEILTRRWYRARDGLGQIVFISGEPGIGKSRLVHAFREFARDNAIYVRTLQCSPHHINSALFPFIEPTVAAIGITPDQSEAEKLDRLEAWIRVANQEPQEIASIFGVYLNIDTSSRYPLVERSAERQKALLFEAFAERLVRLAADSGFMFIVEDAHWIDPTSLELLSMHIDQVHQTAKSMAIVTYRPEFQAPWVGQANTTLMTLNRLDRAHCAELVAGIGGGKYLSEDLIGHISERTDGVPLFIEELTKAVIESGQSEQSAIAVPTTLQDALEARLDRLGDARELLQIGAVIGREFGYRLLSHVSGLADEALRAQLGRLTGSGLVFQRGEPPESTYSFKHALVQDTAYGSLLRRRRGDLHRCVARSLEQNLPDRITTEPDLLAYHYTQGGELATAIGYWSEAGRAAFSQSALKEAIAHLENGLRLIDKMPDDDARKKLEAHMRAQLASYLRTHEGVASETARNAVERALALRDYLANKSQLIPLLFGLANFHWGSGQLALAISEAEDLVELTKAEGDDGLPYALFALALPQFLMGANLQARATFEAIHAAYDPEKHKSLQGIYMQDMGVGSQFHLGNLLFVMGYPDQALVMVKEAIDRGRRGHASPHVASLNYGSVTPILRRDLRTVLDWSEEAISVSEEHQMQQHIGMARINHGWAVGMLEDVEAGLSEIDKGVDLYEKTGRKIWTPLYQVLRSEVGLRSRKYESVLGWTDEAIEMMSGTGEDQFQSPVRIVRGDALMGVERYDDANDCYTRAIMIARDQAAKAWELRAAIRLARVKQREGASLEGRDLLAPVCNWFTEGFDTADLKEARALLDELS